MKIRKQIDDLTIEVWGFYTSDTNIYLDEYRLMTKESKRHRKYTKIKCYQRLSHRGSNITENEVPFTEEIKKEAIDKHISFVRCLKWSERNK